ncbi:MAG TPA: hypothetical protein VFG50_17115 [Rhodothermales bacterium]|nr:hypothetical protein [Rhodothermales bacterium]
MRSLRIRCGLALLLALAGGSRVLHAQPSILGSEDDPRETTRYVWWRRENVLDVMAGPSLIGAQWRVGASIGLNVDTRSVAARLSGSLHEGIYGLYEPDVNQLYDVLRLIEFARYNPPANSSFYFRIGPINRLTLGTGHVVNFHNSNMAWDDRTVGAESRWDVGPLQLSAFTDDLLLRTVMGGRAAIHPLGMLRDPQVRSVSVAFSYVTDRATWRDSVPDLTAYNVDAEMNLLTSGDIVLSPFASYAWYSHYGQGIGVGADLWSLNFIDLARFRFRFALYYNGDRFIPGYVGSFYMVNNTQDRIVNSVELLEGGEAEHLVGLTLGDAVGGNDLVTELRLLLFERFEFWYYFRRHYGIQRLSEYHLRLFIRVQDRLKLDVGLDRGDLSGFLSLFSRLSDQTGLVFNMEYRLIGPLWTYVRSRYTYEQVGQDLLNGDRYVVQRRFEPMVGVRFSF